MTVLKSMQNTFSIELSSFYSLSNESFLVRRLRQLGNSKRLSDNITQLTFDENYYENAFLSSNNDRGRIDPQANLAKGQQFDFYVNRSEYRDKLLPSVVTKANFWHVIDTPKPPPPT